MSSTGVIGAGSWGTAISNLLARAGHEVVLWGRDPVLVDAINSTRHNSRYLKEVELSPNLLASSDILAAVTGREVVVMAVPSQAMRTIATSISGHLDNRQIIVSLTKGLETGTLMRMSQVITEVLPGPAVAALSGPNHAEEVSLNIPCATVIAVENPAIGAKLQELFMTPTFRVYTNKDLLGVEMAAATKNVIAIAVGISDGLGYGDNAKAALMTRGLAEMTRLGVAMGAKAMTYAGLAGIGDLIATCTSRHSRNRAVGERLARGQAVGEAQAELGMVAEGVRTVEAVCALAQTHDLDMPISRAVYDVIYLGKDPKNCVEELMTRGPAEEEL
ncbi:MAG: NAD(P)H-dependent glycerol-3-phosphate dehydrogenase [Actinomycetota bacterium]|nr:NAD(P)H-dependent glycerol-3-phosphate dehydrogenase [Actinomycetota bacterium]